MENHNYFHKKNSKMNIKEAIQKILSTAKENGFHEISTINIKEKFQSAGYDDLQPYYLIEICNPTFAFKRLQKDPYRGAVMPVKINVFQEDDGSVTAFALQIKNETLEEIYPSSDINIIGRRLKPILHKIIDSIG